MKTTQDHRVSTLSNHQQHYTLLLATCLFLLAAAWRGEAQPSNDLCSGAIALTDGVAYSQNTVGATSLGDPSPCGALGNGVWFTFTPAVSGQLNIGTCGSGFFTVVAGLHGQLRGAVSGGLQ